MRECSKWRRSRRARRARRYTGDLTRTLAGPRTDTTGEALWIKELRCALDLKALLPPPPHARIALDPVLDAYVAEVKADVLAHGETVKGAHLMAVWVKGRTSWDSKRLDGYAAAHPEIETFRSVGEPSVTIRSAGK